MRLHERAGTSSQRWSPALGSVTTCRPVPTTCHLPRSLQALSRAFGDAYLKGNDQFEGVSYYASDTYASGFGACTLLFSFRSC